MGNARRAALNALERCRRAGAWSEEVLGGEARAAGLDDRDRALAAALCYGVLQNRLLLDAAIAAVSSVPLGRVEPKVLDLLRLGAYQLLFLDKIPASAAVNEAVELCKTLGYRRAAGYVNAVLRRIAADPRPPVPGGSAAERLSVRWSHPLWLTECLLSLLGAAETETFLRLDNTPPPVTLQVNTLKGTAEALREALAGQGIATEPHPWLPDCLLASDGAAMGTEQFRQGLFYVQDAASRLAVLAAAPQPGQRILDACAAPGGKSFAAAIQTGGRSEITACDKHEKKLKRVREGAARLGLSACVTALAGDAGAPKSAWEGQFDLVLTDVPCSGLGVIRKKPDIRYKDPAAFDGLPAAQHRILSNAARWVRPGGTLVYSTCTVRREENEAVTARFLSENAAFIPEDFASVCGRRSEGGALRLWPQRDGTDGFFIAKLRRTK